MLLQLERRRGLEALRRRGLLEYELRERTGPESGRDGHRPGPWRRGERERERHAHLHLHLQRDRTHERERARRAGGGRHGERARAQSAVRTRVARKHRPHARPRVRHQRGRRLQRATRRTAGRLGASAHVAVQPPLCAHRKTSEETTNYSSVRTTKYCNLQSKTL